MISKSRLKPLTALAFCAVAVPMLIAGCNPSDNPITAAQNGLCCTKFVVGADMTGVDFGLTGQVDGKFKAFAQAGSDLAAVASAALTDVSTACEGIARDVGAASADITTVESMTGDQAAKTQAWCDLAKATITANFSAKGTFGVTAKAEFQPPTCSASVSAQANCEAGCTVSGTCTADAMVSCTGGKLPTVECTGDCTASAMAPSISCTGTCSGMCSGSCTAQANVAVDCTGKCDGDCTVDGMAGSASAVQADGSCSGKCNGTCTASGNAAVACQGTCSGSCDATCSVAPGSAKFECNGTCKTTDGSPPKCEGSAELSCDVSADCKANCQASVSAKAECTPPKVSLALSGTADASVQGQLDIAVASLETNLPQLLVVLEARGKAFTAGISASVDAGGTLTANVGDLSGQAVLCLPPIVSAIASASTNFAAAFQGAVSVTGAVGVPNPS
jgi:hypothetical protein